MLSIYLEFDALISSTGPDCCLFLGDLLFSLATTQSKRLFGGDPAVLGGGEASALEECVLSLPAVLEFRNVVAVAYDPAADA